MPQATRALQLLKQKHIPFIFLTNGGGVTEPEKARELEEKLQVKVDARQVVLAHSPMQSLVDKYKDSPVLIIGGPPEIINVAKYYGFQKPVTAPELIARHPSLWPFTKIPPGTEPCPIDFTKEPFKAILVFYDSFDWVTFHALESLSDYPPIPFY